MKHTKNDLARIVLAIQETLAGKEWRIDRWKPAYNAKVRSPY